MKPAASRSEQLYARVDALWAKERMTEADVRLAERLQNEAFELRRQGK